jgi:hypothetical protein
VLARPLLDTSSRLGSDLATSPTCLPNVSPPALNLVTDLLHFDLQQVLDSSAPASLPLVPRQHTIVLRPRKAKTANLNVTSAPGHSSSLTYEHFTF